MHCLSGEVYEGEFDSRLRAHGEGVWTRGRGVSLDVLALTERYTVIPAHTVIRQCLRRRLCKRPIPRQRQIDQYVDAVSLDLLVLTETRD